MADNLPTLGEMRTSDGDIEAWVKAHLHHGDVRTAYDSWPAPDAIISDGPYGLAGRGGFLGDEKTVKALPDAYRQHVAAWSDRAKATTTLWFWNSELGWATIHPIIEARGWDLVEVVVWDKEGLRANCSVLRMFPIVTELCAFYRRRDCDRGVWNAQYSFTNVWRRKIGEDKRYKLDDVVHPNQKPLAFMRRIIAACTAVGDVVWEPFGGTCSATVAAVAMGRDPYAAEVLDDFYALGAHRVSDVLRGHPDAVVPPLTKRLTEAKILRGG